MKKFIKYFIIFFIIFLSCVLYYTVNWLYATFGDLTINEVVFQLKVPIKGTNTDFIYDFMSNELWYIIASSIIIYLLVALPKREGKEENRRIRRRKRRAKRMKDDTRLTIISGGQKIIQKLLDFKSKYIFKLAVSITILVMSCSYVTHKTDLMNYINDQLSDSEFIENEYVDPQKVSLEFPEKKRNLIYIYLESMESTFYSKDLGGAEDKNWIKEFSDLAEKNVAFSTGDRLQGSYTLPGTTWTVGGMVAQTMGLPLKIAVNANGYGQYDSFLPGAYSLGQILEKEGYNQLIMFGSDAVFGGRKNLFEQHGAYKIWDYNSAIKEKRMTEDQKVWWGFSDKDLVKYAKEKILELSKEDEPFNFTMLTVDTHHIGRI